jgi:hypothetical protein
MKVHEPSAAAKVALCGLGQEFLLKTITRKEYTERGSAIMRDDRLQCRKSCCRIFRQRHRRDDQ